MEHIIWFENCSHNDKLQVGGKNASLGELKALSQSMGMPVGDGFAITTKVYDDFCKENNVEQQIDTHLKGLTVDNIEGINKASEEIKTLFIKGSFPLGLIDEIRESYFKLNELYGGQIEVAVRSSAIAEDMPQASFAGQQDTFLNIPNVVKLMDAIVLCFDTKAVTSQSRNTCKMRLLSRSIPRCSSGSLDHQTMHPDTMHYQR